MEHCRHAFGAVLTDCDGAKVVYSGDTRPCQVRFTGFFLSKICFPNLKLHVKRLVEAGKNAVLLLHEATFEDQLQSHAISKRHSSVSEALDSAVAMAAQQVVLTHFSQRYAAGPELPADHALRSATMLAFDGLCITLTIREGDECGLGFKAKVRGVGTAIVDAQRAAASYAAKNTPNASEYDLV